MYKQYLMVLKFEQIDKPNVKNQNHLLGRGFFFNTQTSLSKTSQYERTSNKKYDFVVLCFMIFPNPDKHGDLIVIFL